MAAKGIARLCLLSCLLGLLLGVFGPRLLDRMVGGPNDPDVLAPLPRGWVGVSRGTPQAAVPIPKRFKPVVALSGRVESAAPVLRPTSGECPTLLPENLGGKCDPVVAVNEFGDTIATMQLTVWADTASGRVQRGPLAVGTFGLPAELESQPEGESSLTGTSSLGLERRWRLEGRLLATLPNPGLRAGVTLYPKRSRVGLAADYESVWRDGQKHAAIAAGVAFSFGRK